MSHTLLLADDSVTIQRVIELTFADEDIQVIAVGDGQQAIDQIVANPPDVVLVDSGMPERNGYEVADFIKKDPALAHIPVVLMTGAFESVDEDRAQQVGCDAVLVKPFAPQVVVNRVRELLGQRSATAVPAPSRPVMAVPPQHADADALTPPAEAARRPAHDLDETLELVSPVRTGAVEAALPPDDPLADYLERMDEAFERFEGEKSAPLGRERTVVEEPRSTLTDTSASEKQDDALEGALSVLEGALDKLGLESPDVPAVPDIPPRTSDGASPPPDRSPEAPAVPVAPSPTSDAASLPPVRLAEAPESTAESGSASKALAAARPWVPSPAASVVPVASALDTPDMPPSLADAFASLLAAEQGGAERADTLYPWPRPASSISMPEALIDQVVDRVVERLTDGVTGELVADVVARVAEKLVREALEQGKPE
jgi:CheY-like chemotaxis protein